MLAKYYCTLYVLGSHMVSTSTHLEMTFSLLQYSLNHKKGIFLYF